MCACFDIITSFVCDLVSSVLVICHLNITLTEAGVMHEAAYIYCIRSTWYHFPFGYFTAVHFIIWEVLLAIARFDLVRNLYVM